MRARITKRFVDTLKGGAREYFRWDADLLGFGVRVQPSGTKAYIVKYRAGSGRTAPTRRMTLGSVGKLTPDQARNLAKKALSAVVHGADPAAEKAAEKRAETLGDLKLKSGTSSRYKDILERIVLPEFGRRKVEKISTDEFARLHLRMREHP